MIVNLTGEELDCLYRKAHENYLICITNSENSFLHNELSHPLQHINLINYEVKVVFKAGQAGIYSLQAILILEDPFARMIGRYEYNEDSQGNTLDDVLIFY